MSRCRILWALLVPALVCPALVSGSEPGSGSSSAAMLQTPLLGANQWHADGNQAGALFGSRLATAGDVNGDGYSDWLVAAPSYDVPPIDAGQVSLFLGSPGGVASPQVLVLAGNQGGAGFGKAISTAGDVNGDGFSDVLIGAPDHDGLGIRDGRVFLFLGSAAGLSQTPAWTADGEHAGDLFGSSVSTAGDVNGDGYSDIVVGATSFALPATPPIGRAYVYYGSPTGPGTLPDWTADGEAAFVLFGNSVSTAGDVNGDGYSDVMVGSYGFGNVPRQTAGWGKVYVYHGSPSGLFPTPAWTREGLASGARYGWSVGTAGDTNADGYADILVGAPGSGGLVELYTGSAVGLELVAGATWTGAAGDFLGGSVGTAGDVNADGYADVLIGDPQRVSPTGGPSGAVFVFLGSSSGPDQNLAMLFEADQSALLGQSVALAGDVNGDGYSDILISQPKHDDVQFDEGRAYLFTGNYSIGDALDPDPTWILDAGGPAAVSDSAGDVNGDGFDDVIVGSPHFASFEVDEGGAFVFHGSAAGPSTTADWSVEGNVAGRLLGGVRRAGDVNGDGFDDVLVSSPVESILYMGSAVGLSTIPAWSVAGTDPAPVGDLNRDGYGDIAVVAGGSVRVFFGLPGGPSTIATFIVPGVSVAAGDWDGGGYDDLFVGNPNSEPGLLQIYSGPMSGLESPAWTILGEQFFSGFGAALAAGDMNGNGQTEVVVAAPGFGAAPVPLSGRVYYCSFAFGCLPLFTGDSGERAGSGGVAAAGSVNGFNGVAFAIGSSGGTIERFRVWTALPLGDYLTRDSVAPYAFHVAGGGDLNGDGFAETMVSAGETIQIHAGRGIGPTLLARQRQPDDSRPISVAGLSDEVDRFRIAAVGRTLFGRGRVKLEWRVELAGGTQVVSAAGLSWNDTGTGGVAVSELVDGLVAGTSYSWKARFRYHPAVSPYQQSGRWFSLPRADFRSAKLRTQPECLWHLDLDGDGFGGGNLTSPCNQPPPGAIQVGGDCNDGDATVFPGAPEISDGQDNECSGDPGAGLIDDISGFAGISGDGQTLLWPAQPGATSYDVIRSPVPDFSASCQAFSTATPAWPVVQTPLPGQILYYLVRSATPNTGSWGRARLPQPNPFPDLERQIICPSP